MAMPTLSDPKTRAEWISLMRRAQVIGGIAWIVSTVAFAVISPESLVALPIRFATGIFMVTAVWASFLLWRVGAPILPRRSKPV